MTDDDAEQILLQIDVDGDASNLTFEEFVAIMDGMKVRARVSWLSHSLGAQLARSRLPTSSAPHLRLLTSHTPTLVPLLQTEGNNKFDLASTFAKKAKEKSAFFQGLDPLYVRMQREREKMRKKNGEG